MTVAEQSKIVGEALKVMAENIDKGFDAFNARMQEEFPDAYSGVAGEVRAQVNWAEGALLAARGYVRERAEWCRLYGDPHKQG